MTNYPSRASLAPDWKRAIASASACGWLLLVCLFAVPTRAQYRFDHWTADNGLPQNSVRDIRQTRDGYLWLATSDGLVRFDGVRFTVFDKSNSPGMTTNRFACLYEDRDGALWAGTENGGLTRYQHGAFTTYTAQHGLPHNEIKNLAGDDAGQVWVLSGERIVRWEQGRFVHVDLKGLQIGFQSSFYNRQIFFGVDETAVYRFAQGRLTTWPLPRDLLRQCNLYFEEDPSGTLWMGLRAGRIAKIKDGKVLNIFRVSEAMRDARGGRSAQPELTLEYRDRQGQRWTMSVDQELIRSLTLPATDQMETVSFISFCEDREGNLWLGTNGQGLYRVRKQAITVYSQPQGLVDRNVYPIYEDRAGVIWIGAWRSGLSRFEAGRFTSFTPQSGLASGMVTSLGEDREGRLWVSAHDNRNGGLRVFQNGRFTGLNAQIIPERARAATIHQDAQGALWFGTERGLVRYQHGTATLFTTQDGRAGDDVRVIIEDAAGALWIGAYGGLTRYQDGKFTAYTERDGLPSNTVRALYQDRAGVLWIGTYDGGLGRFQDGHFTRYTIKEGLFNNGVFQILEDARGNFWMSCNRGIYRVRKQELNEFAAGARREITAVAYGKSDGMLNVECNGGIWPAGIKARDGKLWFPTQDGVAVIDPEAIPNNQQAPPVVLESFSVNNQAVAVETWQSAIRNPNSAIQIRPQQESFEIGYTALSFINSEHLKFKYRLVGLDRDWNEVGTRRTAYYSHVPPGEYVFQVIAANSDGVWNVEGRSLRIIVVPPFYRTWWFLTLAALGVIGVAFLSYRYRIAQLERAQATQQAFSRQLLESQETERKRIAAELHDGLSQSLVIIKNRAALSLTTPADHDRAFEQLREIADASTHAIDEVKEIIYDLRPIQLDRLGFTKAVADMLNKIAATHELEVIAQLDPIDGLFAKEAENSLYRILQEGVNNIVRHAAATRAEVTIRRNARSVEVTIKDNGRGFAITDLGLRMEEERERGRKGEGETRRRAAQTTDDGQQTTDNAVNPKSKIQNPKSKGFGLTGIIERARLFGGQPLIESTPGNGTTITIHFPITNTSV